MFVVCANFLNSEQTISDTVDILLEIEDYFQQREMCFRSNSHFSAWRVNAWFARHVHLHDYEQEWFEVDSMSGLRWRRTGKWMENDDCNCKVFFFFFVVSEYAAFFFGFASSWWLYIWTWIARIRLKKCGELLFGNCSKRPGKSAPQLCALFDVLWNSEVLKIEKSKYGIEFDFVHNAVCQSHYFENQYLFVIFYINKNTIWCCYEEQNELRLGAMCGVKLTHKK